MTIERIRVTARTLSRHPIVLAANDVVLVVGRREGVVAFGANGNEIADIEALAS